MGAGLQQLPERTRRCLLAQRLDGLTYSEIALREGQGGARRRGEVRHRPGSAQQEFEATTLRQRCAVAADVRLTPTGEFVPSPATEGDAALRPAPANHLSHLSQLNRRFRPALMSFFLRRLRNHAEAEDLTQEVFVRLARSGREVETAEAYIFQTAANQLRDRARHERTRAAYRLGLGALQAEQVEVLDPARVLVGREALGRLIGGLEELPERTREIFILYRLENMTRVEIAGGLGISVSAVEKHLARAMVHLARRLEDGK